MKLFIKLTYMIGFLNNKKMVIYKIIRLNLLRNNLKNKYKQNGCIQSIIIHIFHSFL